MRQTNVDALIERALDSLGSARCKDIHEWGQYHNSRLALRVLAQLAFPDDPDALLTLRERVPRLAKAALNLEALCALAASVAMKATTDDQRTHALALFDLAYRRLGAQMPREYRELHVTTAHLHGRKRLVRRLLQSYSGISAMLIDSIDCQNAHPRLGGSVRAYLRKFRRFTDWTELKAPERGAPLHFDGLRTAPLKPIEKGPMISVVMTCFQPGEGLLTAVRSVVAQTWQNWELLLVDDGSGPEYEPILLEAAALDPRVKLLIQPENAGTYQARNRAMAVAKGKFITGLDSDDWSHPTRLAKQVRPMLSNDGLVMVESRCIAVAEDLSLMIDPQIALIAARSTPIMIRAEAVLKKVGFYDEVRKTADSEYRFRVKAAFGDQAALRMGGGPLTAVRYNGSTLSAGEVSRHWMLPSRFAYHSGFSRWHRAIGRGQASPFMASMPRPRPFPIANDITRSNAENRAIVYGRIYAADWSALDAKRRMMLDEAANRADEGVAVGLLHCPDWVGVCAEQALMDRTVLKVAAAHGLDFVEMEARHKAPVVVPTAEYAELLCFEHPVLDARRIEIMPECTASAPNTRSATRAAEEGDSASPANAQDDAGPVASASALSDAAKERDAVSNPDECRIPVRQSSHFFGRSEVDAGGKGHALYPAAASAADAVSASGAAGAASDATAAVALAAATAASAEFAVGVAGASTVSATAADPASGRPLLRRAQPEAEDRRQDRRLSSFRDVRRGDVLLITGGLASAAASALVAKAIEPAALTWVVAAGLAVWAGSLLALAAWRAVILPAVAGWPPSAPPRPKPIVPQPRSGKRSLLRKVARGLEKRPLWTTAAIAPLLPLLGVLAPQSWLPAGIALTVLCFLAAGMQSRLVGLLDRGRADAAGPESVNAADIATVSAKKLALVEPWEVKLNHGWSTSAKARLEKFARGSARGHTETQMHALAALCAYRARVRRPARTLHVDIVIVSTLNLKGGTTSANEAEVLAYRSAGLTVGLVNHPVKERAAGRPVDPKIRALFDDEGVFEIGPDDTVHCDLAIMRFPVAFEDIMEDRPEIKAARTVLLVNQTPFEEYGPTGGYGTAWSIGAVHRNVTDWVGPHTWYAIGPAVRDVLRTHHAEEMADIDLAEDFWYETIDIADWTPRQRRHRAEGEPIRLGRHSRDHVTKFPNMAKRLRAAYPDAEGIEVHMLGAHDALQRILGTIPERWTSHPFGSMSAVDFLGEVDVYAYFIDENLLEAFGRAPLEAMAAGVPCLLSPDFAELFGDGAIYCEPGEVEARVRELGADRAYYAERAAAGLRVVEERFSPDALLRRVKGLGVKVDAKPATVDGAGAGAVAGAVAATESESAVRPSLGGAR
ncbi:glycosyltransferase [Glycomyces niveus]|uniref:Glycosyltransferase n=1 Tax=Glycomyces niveus TaxID=2820287 RepID=A0ABS3U1R8_9ACTN|nr:glycosyltransferase [Glycomyces sp. NEAU-S30]MBO3732715.1 glycosyltransferase [Glycomyces sp. NEAU-S30]